MTKAGRIYSGHVDIILKPALEKNQEYAENPGSKEVPIEFRAMDDELMFENLHPLSPLLLSVAIVVLYLIYISIWHPFFNMAQPFYQIVSKYISHCVFVF